MQIIQPCRHAGCYRLTDRPSGYCQAHQSDEQKTYKDFRPSSSKRGYNSRWSKASKTFLSVHPWCAECERSGIKKPAECVDHIKPHRGDQKLFWDKNNWQPLCNSCHSKKTAQEENGGWY